MKFFSYPSVIILLSILLFSCNKRITNGENKPPPDQNIYPSFGTDATLDVATWNIEQFPKAGQQTINDVVRIIRELQVDLYAVQEITDEQAFQRTLDSLPQFQGKIGNLPGSFALWPAVIYNSEIIQVLRDTLLFQNDYDYPRPAFSLYISASHNNQTFDFTLIVLHLKAFGDPTSQGRRRRAVQKLKAYIDGQIQNGGDPDYIVAGDWNDLLEDVEAENIFLPFLNDTATYLFLTLPFAGSNEEYSYIGGSFKSIIDHILITRSISDTYNPIETRILKLDEYFTSYLNEVSDHRPVAARIPVF